VGLEELASPPTRGSVPGPVLSGRARPSRSDPRRSATRHRISGCGSCPHSDGHSSFSAFIFYDL